MFRDQYPLAERSIEELLIPWIETSELDEADRRSILSQTEALLPKIKTRELTTQQLSRLHNCLQDNPVLLWGVVQSIQRQAQGLVSEDGQSGLTALEIETLDRLCERLLRSAAERKLSRNDLEFAFQTCSKMAPNGSGVTAKPDLTAEQVRQFMQRAEHQIKQEEIPDEPYKNSPAEAYRELLRAALDVK